MHVYAMRQWNCYGNRHVRVYHYYHYHDHCDTDHYYSRSISHDDDL